MKSLKMLMMAALSILTISLFAQSNTTKSKKELMKMEVMKIHTTPQAIITEASAKDGFASNLSPKEQLKRNVVKWNAVTRNNDVAGTNSGKCPDCLSLSNLSPKEQMKMKEMDLLVCSMSAGIASGKIGKCAICGMDLVAVNK